MHERDSASFDMHTARGHSQLGSLYSAGFSVESALAQEDLRLRAWNTVAQNMLLD